MALMWHRWNGLLKLSAIINFSIFQHSWKHCDTCAKNVFKCVKAFLKCPPPPPPKKKKKKKNVYICIPLSCVFGICPIVSPLKRIYDYPLNLPISLIFIWVVIPWQWSNHSSPRWFKTPLCWCDIRPVLTVLECWKAICQKTFEMRSFVPSLRMNLGLRLL